MPIGSTDTPARKWNILIDEPALHPGYGHEELADCLADIICTSKPRFAIAIFGKWGTGKSTLMEGIESRLESNRTIPVRFNAWRYQNEKDIIVPLLESIKSSLAEWASTDSSVSDTVKNAAKRTAGVLAGLALRVSYGLSVNIGLPVATLTIDGAKALQNPKDQPGKIESLRPSTYQAAFEELQSTVSQFYSANRTRIVIFVDDLDRCLPTKALDVLDTMKLFFDIEGVVFVVGLDQEVIDSAIGARFRMPDGTSAAVIDGRMYTRKIFQLQYAVSPIRPGDLEGLVKSMCRDLPTEQNDHIMTCIMPHLRYLSTNLVINPREVKRFINAYTLQMKYSRWHDSPVILSVMTVRFREDWSALYEAMLSDPAFVDSLKHWGSDPSHYERRAAIRADYKHLNIPASFFEYIEGPGSTLILVDDVAGHLLGVERANSTDVRPVQALATIGRIRSELKAWAGRDAGGHPGDRALMDTFEDLEEHVRGIDDRTGATLMTRARSALQLQLEHGTPIDEPVTSSSGFSQLLDQLVDWLRDASESASLTSRARQPVFDMSMNGESLRLLRSHLLEIVDSNVANELACSTIHKLLAEARSVDELKVAAVGVANVNYPYSSETLIDLSSLLLDVIDQHSNRH